MCCPITGVWSILKSPVCTTGPSGVSMIIPAESGIECETEKNSTERSPIEITWPGSTTCTSISSISLWSFSLTWSRPRVSRVQKTGTGNSRNRNAAAPMWSS